MSAFIHGEIFADTWEGMSAIAAVEVDGTNLTLHRLVILANPRYGCKSAAARGDSC